MNWSTETFKKLARKVIHAEGTPREVGLAFGIGVFIAWFPIFGTHTLLVFFLAWLFRLSPAVVLAGAFVNNPFTFVPMYLAGFWLGMEITGNGAVEIAWNMDITTLKDLALAYVVPFCIGNTILGIVGGIVSYFPVTSAVVRYRRRRDEARERERTRIMEESRVNG